MSRTKIHQNINDLLLTLSNDNTRLSLHPEKLSSLDIDTFKKHCIELYENINHLTLESEVVSQESIQSSNKSEITKLSPIQTENKPVPQPMVDRLSEVLEEDEKLSLFEKFSNTPIKNIAKGMSVAKRFEFQNVFFKSDMNAYSEFIQKIDSVTSIDEALEIYKSYKSALEWENEDLLDELKALIYRKYG
jgi:hypothetical protein